MHFWSSESINSNCRMLLFGPRLQWTDFFMHLINKKLIYKWSCVCTVSYIWKANNFALHLPWSFMLDSSVFCTDFATFAIIDIILETQRPQRKKLDTNGFKFQASLRNCINCLHNSEDHSSFDFISAVLIWFISYTFVTFISFTGTYMKSTHVWT